MLFIATNIEINVNILLQSFDLTENQTDKITVQTFQFKSKKTLLKDFLFV